MGEKGALLTIRVGDAKPGTPSEQLIDELAHLVHASAVAHYGDRPDCRFSGFAPDFGGREEFEEKLDDLGVGPADRARHLAEWDASQRPIAIVHFWIVEAAGTAFLGGRVH